MILLPAAENGHRSAEIISLGGRMDRLQAMAVFARVAELRGLAAAARALGLSPAAVTRAVAGLEAHLGARLLTRTTRRVRLTEAGRSYLTDVRRILLEIAEAEAAAAGSHGTAQGVLRITAPTQFGRLHLGPALPAFLDAHPLVVAELLLVDRLVDLVDEGVDVALRIGQLEQGSLVALRLGQVRRVVVGSPAYLARAGEPREPDDLAAHRLIAAASLMRGDAWGFVVGGVPRAVPVAARLRTSQPDLAIDVARAGYGLTRVPIYQVAEELRQGALRIVLAAYEEPPVPVSLVTVEGRRASARVRAFVDFVLPRLRQVLARLG
jgi:DNA-binding transcriptional LysR family regulator